MKAIKLIFTILLLFLSISTYAQNRKISGKVVLSTNKPIEGAIISASGSQNAKSDAEGKFSISVNDKVNQVTVWAEGYYQQSRYVDKNQKVIIQMMPNDAYKYNESAVLPLGIDKKRPQLTSAVNITKKDFTLGSMTIDCALAGQVAGLQVVRNGGMPGEGSYMNMRGLHTFIGNNAPLIVINGVPYLPDTRESQLIEGYTRNIFQAYNINDIQNITVLKGADASMYASIGSNGVILIETDGATSDNLETRVSFSGQYGVHWNNKRIPLLKGNGYKSYLSDIGMTYFNNMESLFNDFPFLSSPNCKNSFLYNNNTDWQNEIYNKGFVTDNLFRVEGGDAIAKYNLSLGYALNNGITDFTQSQRYHTQLNTNVLISKWVEINATVGLAYLNGNYQQQGMDNKSNPILAAYSRSPLLSPYKMDNSGNILSSYSSYYYGDSQNMDFAVSNPLAIINNLDARNRQYDVNIKIGLSWKPMMGLSFNGTFGMFYNYNKEHLFIPGLTDHSTLPINDQYGTAENSVKEGVGEQTNFFADANAKYEKTFNGVHKFSSMIGAQMLITNARYEAGAGRNTPNDFYQTLSDVKDIGRYFYGYLEKWNWANLYAHAEYTYHNMVATSLNMSFDGASSSGTYGTRMFAYPSLGVTLLGKGWSSISNSTVINRLNIRAEYGLSGNSQFSSNLGKYYYTSSPYMTNAGIIRANISNTNLKPERTTLLNLSLDLGMWNNRLALTFDYYNNVTNDVIFAVPHSSAFGTLNYYDNCGKIKNHGVELAIQATLMNLKDFKWIVGGNIARNISEVESLGTASNLVTSYIDGAKLISMVGNSPYQFYGYQTLGVFSTQAEADLANLKNVKGQKFQAGDVHFVDQNLDGRIDDKDRVALGNAAPKYFGGFFTQFCYKSFALSAEFSYSKGNKAYNAVRRSLESLSTFGNQSEAVENRWSLEGQQTGIPRAQWNDPMGNNDFSDRWIEDASYLRLKNLTLSYSFDKKFLNFFRSGTLYLTGENLLTFTKYLGLDPEFSYSYSESVQGFDYAKMMQPKSIKFGVNLNF